MVVRCAAAGRRQRCREDVVELHTHQLAPPLAELLSLLQLLLPLRLLPRVYPVRMNVSMDRLSQQPGGRALRGRALNVFCREVSFTSNPISKPLASC